MLYIEYLLKDNGMTDEANKYFFDFFGSILSRIMTRIQFNFRMKLVKYFEAYSHARGYFIGCFNAESNRKLDKIYGK